MEKKSRYGKIFYSCNRYPQCKYALWDLPINEPCPKCGHPVIVEKVTKRDGTYRKCPTETCDYRLVLVEPEKKATAKKAPAKTPADKKEPVKKAPVKKAPAKKLPAKKPAAAGTAAKKTAAPAKKTAGKSVKKTS
jgi:DNA topoisomerase-1